MGILDHSRSAGAQRARQDVFRLASWPLHRGLNSHWAAPSIFSPFLISVSIHRLNKDPDF